MVRKVSKAAVIGAGVMGSGIAALLASIGIKTLLLDMVPPGLTEKEKKEKKKRDGIALLSLNALKQSKPPALMEPEAINFLSSGNLEDDFSKLSECDWIIEAIIENVKIKQDLFKRVESVRKKSSIVSTNTSGIPLKTLSKNLGADFKSHFLGVHFFNPVRYMKLAEIIPGEETKEDVLEFISLFLERRLGKGIVWAKDTPNFIGNRIGIHGMLKAMALMSDAGLNVIEVDALLGRAIGRPKTALFKTADLVGLDILYHVANNTYELTPNDEEREIFKAPSYLEKMVQNKQLGKKTHAGFYKTEITKDWQTKRTVINPTTLEYGEITPPDFPCLVEAKKHSALREKIRAVLYGEDKGARFAFKAIAANLIYSVNRLGEIADTIVEIDNAMKWGFNFDLGPFELWDEIGLENSIQRMEKAGYSVPEKIKQMLAAGHTTFYREEKGSKQFYDFNEMTYHPYPTSPHALQLAPLKSAKNKVVASCPSASLVDIGDGVFCFEFHTKMNALNTEILDFHNETMKIVEEKGVGLVIGNEGGGMPGAFSAGADLKYMVKLASEKKYDAIESFVTSGQHRLHHAQYTSFPIVAAPYGLTLGGGCEVCLSADRIVAHAELYMGLVEIGVGLLPAGGGCTNLWKKFLNSLPSAVTEIDLTKVFVPAFMNIALAKISSSAMDARNLGFLGPEDRIVMNRDHLISEAKKEVLRMVDDGYTPPLKKRVRVVGKACQGMINAEIYNMQKAGFITEYDAVLAKKIAYVLSGGEVSYNAVIDEDVILTLERESFLALLKEQKTLDRITHMLEKGKPLRN